MRKSRKFMKRLFGILISIVMMMGMMATTVFAADGSATITITKPSDFTAKLTGMTVSAYKVLDVANPDEENQDKWIYKVDPDFDEFFNIDDNAGNGTVEDAFGEGPVYLTYTGNKLQASTTKPANGTSFIELTGDKAKKLDATYAEADLISRLTGDSGSGESQNALLYTWIEKYIEFKGDSIQADKPTPTSPAGENDAKIVIGGLDEGYYALIFKGVPSGISVKQGILIATKGTSAELNLKAETIPFTKEVADSDDPSASDLVWEDNASAAIGDTLTYHIKTKVPTLTDYENLTKFEISDTLANQKLDTDSITIKIGSTVANRDTQDDTIFKIGDTQIATLTESTAYDDTNNEGSFTLRFEPSALEGYEGEEIIVTYTAKLTTDAVKINENTATLDYTNNGDNGQLTDETEVYTYGIQVSKKFSDGSNDYSQVKFELYDEHGTKLMLTGLEGVYKLADSKAEGTVTELALTDSGTLTITGLDDDVDYILKETKTADKFNIVGDITISLAAQTDSNGMLLDPTTTKININGTNAPVTFDNNTETSEKAIATAKFEVLNQKGFNLPQTGGAGTWMLTIGGIVLIAAAAGLFVVSRKRSSK